MINFQNCIYLKSVPDISFKPTNDYPEILFVGKSNVGKSSLLNALSNNKHLAKVSQTPGKTKYLNYFLLDNKYYLIDSPGYGFVSDKKLEFEEMMSTFFSSKFLKGVVFILDSRRLLSLEDKVFYNNLIDKNIPFFIVLSKIDKLKQRDKINIFNDIHKNFKIVNDNEIITFSFLDKRNLDKIKNKIEFLLKN